MSVGGIGAENILQVKIGDVLKVTRDEHKKLEPHMIAVKNCHKFCSDLLGYH